MSARETGKQRKSKPLVNIINQRLLRSLSLIPTPTSLSPIRTMGQRHQVYLIARVLPHGAPPACSGNRRSVAGFHHQWSCGSLPLAAAHRFITLLSNPHNAAIVRAELQAIDGKYGQHGYLRPLIPNIPCPYTTSLLGSAWTTNLNAGEEFYSSGVTLHQAVLPAYVGCWDGGESSSSFFHHFLRIHQPHFRRRQ